MCIVSYNCDNHFPFMFQDTNSTMSAADEAATLPTVMISDDSIVNDETTPLVEEDDDDTREERQSAPKDRYYFVYFVFVLVGITTLLPWNFFISLNNFWDYKFRNVSDDITVQKKNSSLVPTELQKDFTSYLAISSTIPNAIFVIINALLGQRFSISKRLTYSLLMMILMFTAITALAFINTDNWQRTFLGMLLFLVVIVNINSAVFQGNDFKLQMLQEPI